MKEVSLYQQVHILTGGIGSGKTTVSNILKELGAKVICADTIARMVVAPGEIAFEKIKHEFRSIVISDGIIDRKALGNIVFKDSSSRTKLEKITHPEIRKKSLQLFASAIKEENEVIVYDCPLYFETELSKIEFKSVICVTSSLENRLQRLLKRDSLDKKQIEERIASQIPLEFKAKKSDFVICNDSTIEKLKQDVKKLFSETLLRR